MPPPPSRRYATPASEFGIAKPVNEWFDFAASGSPQTGPSFSRGLDEADTRATQRELEQLKLQRELRSERALDNFLTQAAGQNPRGLMQLIQDSPDLLTNEQAPGIQSYVKSQLERQKAMRAEKEPFSTKVLAPSIVKNLTADQQVRFYRNINKGLPVDEAFDAMEMEGNLQKRSAKQREAAIEYIKKGFSPEKVKEALQSDDFELALAALEGASKGGGGRDDLLDRIAKVDGLLRTAQDANPDGGATVDAYASMRDALMKQWQAQQLGIDAPAAAGAAAAGGAAAPGAATVTPGAAAAGAATTEPAATATAEPVLPPLSPFEAAERNKPSAVDQAIARERSAVNQSWSEAKDAAITGLLPDSKINPNRMVSLAQDAILGNPLTGVTPQEKQFAEKVSQYAMRALEGKKVVIGERYVTTEPGVSMAVPVEVSPGYALMQDMGVDPNKEVVIPDAGFFFGGDKPMKAYQLLDLRLKEIAQPLIESRKAAKVEQRQAELTPKVAKGLEKIQGQVNTPK